MQLIIAEKPSVARDLARVLGVRGSGKHALEGPGRVITWCIGHLVELEEPAAYQPSWKAWRLDTLPMVPAAFKLRPVPGTRDQLRAVERLLGDRRFREVVNACDAGREGELIFRYVYELARSRLPIKRLWISSLTDEAIRAGFAGLRPGGEFDALAAAARCRSEADWLVGMNATRAVTVSARGARPSPAPSGRDGRGAGGRSGQGDSPLYSIGRVQTPTLAIVVRRELEIRQFRPRDYWELRGVFAPVPQTGASADGAAGDEVVTATWFVTPPDGKAARTRLAERALADAVLARAQSATESQHGEHGDAGPVVERLRQRRVHEPPPLLFDLTSLQRTANRRYGLSATATLAAAQALYERYKVLTYPRTDSRHLTSDMVDELPKVARALAAVPEYAPFVAPLLAQPPPRPRRVFADSKVSDHHAIIPTAKAAAIDQLPRDERRVFDLVVRRFLGAFHPDAEFALTDVVIRVGRRDTAAPAVIEPKVDDAVPDETLVTALPPPPDRFRARGRVRLVAGWQTVAQLGEGRSVPPGATKGKGESRGDSDAGEDGGGPTLPPLVEGQRLRTRKLEALTRQTRPPPRHTEASLLGAMESAGHDIADDELRAAMRDSGLGTPATRAATIETLLRRGFVVRNAKNLEPTEMGIGLIEALPEKSLASPELTGTWEARLTRMARGQEARPAFMADIARYVGDVVTAIRGRPAGLATKPVGHRSSAPAVDSEGRPQPPRAREREAPVPANPPPRRGGPTRGKARPPTRTGTATSGPTAAAPLTCPRCRQAALVAGNRGWGCARWREGCAFVIWFEVAGRRITEAELAELVAKGRTRKRTWRGPDGAPVTGRLVLDLEAPRELGGARLDTAASPPRKRRRA